MTGLHELSIAEASVEIRERRVSPVELTLACLQRSGEVEERIGAFSLVMEERALSAARAAEKEVATGHYRGPLHGIPVALKDLYDLEGVPTSASSRVRRDHVATSDSAVAERLARAGAICVGKTHTHEFAFGVTTPTTRNPWDTNRIPGGSSGGSGAAVAAGSCAMAMGTDTGGSIRIPAALCGTVGLKPTFGRVSTYGVTPLAWSLDHAGPLTRTVRDAAIVLGAVAGHDRRDPSSADRPVPDYVAALEPGLRGVRVGIPSNYFFDLLSPDVEGSVRRALSVLASLGAQLAEVVVPYPEHMLASLMGIVTPEANAYHHDTLRTRPEDYGDDVRRALEAGESALARQYIGSLRMRTRVKEGFERIFDAVDVIACPTVPMTAAQVGQSTYALPDGEGEVALADALVRASVPASLAGLPALSVPCDPNPAGLPVGLQVIGRPFDEATVLAVGHSVELAMGDIPRIAPL